ncbi:RNA 2',3'-cyclic 3'-phosphodiesterase [Methylomarinovum caldicuralii]|uniref:RNA 2',3'-cyclic phosphodiesterase n=1 Tax=Methylomarinovum caldicuralii TaxID=438856 RepID=A0AAU9C045_9GAMM|nr:RNA 2',3'-cyclic phosphodiesterase [Methylomarinovum caldicuralii]BCX80908.1 RNA 2',3'-cyclic 3'-phosphodiesterase [Methylomarinovum caldicuralii]
MEAGTPSKSRLFFALWPDETVIEAVERVRGELGLDQGRPVPEENLHITLLFLGDVPDEAIDDLKALADRLALAPCEIVLDRLEHWVRPAVLCLTASEVPEPVAELVNLLKRGVRKLGFKPEKCPFRPHLTLARKVRRRVVERRIEPVRWPVRDFVLVKSERDDRGSRYTILGRWPSSREAVP